MVAYTCFIDKHAHILQYPILRSPFYSALWFCDPGDKTSAAASMLTDLNVTEQDFFFFFGVAVFLMFIFW